MTRMLRVGGASSLLAAVALAFGCQSIVGIEDKTLDICGDKCVACEEYCDLAMTNCTEEHAVWRDREYCVALCNELPLGDLGEPANENTVACRMEQARLAGEMEPELHCNGAGPAGGNLCGSDCESFCYLYRTLCDSPFVPEELSEGEGIDDVCLDKCRALRDDPVFDVNGYYDTDTVECRIIHFANVPALGDSHCGHGEFQSSLHCSPPATDPEGNPIPPSCFDMCRVAMVACEGENAVYDDNDTCMATCEKLPPGLNTDNHENSVGCRHYHSYNSITNPVTHCSHAGPGGAGHCGEIVEGAGNCESYCILAKAGCETDFAAAFPGGDEECRTACAQIPGVTENNNLPGNETEQYSVALGESGLADYEFQCRLLHTTRAIKQGGQPTVECSAVFGATGSACDL
jgi:hypothetical protein